MGTGSPPFFVLNYNPLVEAETPEDVWKAALNLLQYAGLHRYSLIHAPFCDSARLFSNKDPWISELWIDSIRSKDLNLRGSFDAAILGPFVWGVEKQIFGLTPSPQEKAFRQKVFDAGYINSFTIPLWNVTPRYQSIFTVMTSLETTVFKIYLDKNYAFFYMLANAVHARLNLLLASKERKRVRLSPRERECLRCFSIGLRNNRISEILGITESTIEFHTQNARRKLEARTREEAITKALTLGLLSAIESSIDAKIEK